MRKSILVSIIAVFTVLTLLSLSAVSAAVGELTAGIDVSVNGVDYISGENVIGIEAGETVPIKVVFRASEDASDVVVKAFIDGYRNDITAKTDRFELVNESIYTKYLSLKVPSDIDPTEDYTLTIRISNKDKSDELEFKLKLQRGSYNIDVLSVEAPREAVAGTTIAVDVVLKNWGMHDLEDVFVKARITDLGIEKKVYFNDINPLDESEYDISVREANRQDSAERRVYLTIPENAKTGTYVLEVEAYNVDDAETAKTNIVISGEEEISEIFAGATIKTLNIGEETSYDLTIVNTGSKMRVYTLTPEKAEGLLIDIEPIVTVPADSSKTVKVGVKATESADEGTNVVTIKVESEEKLVKTVSFTANVEKTNNTVRANSIVILTIVLVIVFVVLLIILIVLLTRKPASVETEETSYY